jgi:ribosome-associated toxin RatA of RatAB toxin-antitoxin module
MKRIPISWGGALRAAVLALTTSLAAGSPAHAEAADMRIFSEAVPGSDIPWSVVEAVIDAPPEAVWALVSRCNEYKRTMPRIADSKELSRAPDGMSMVCRVTADMPFPIPDLTSTTQARHKVDPGKRYERTWKLVEGDYDINEGSWVLEAMGDGNQTRATYRLRAKPKMPVPDSMLGLFQQKALPDVIKGVRAQTRNAARRAEPKTTPAPPPPQEAQVAPGGDAGAGGAAAAPAAAGG